MNIILCGLPMSGKTTIGKMISEKLQWNFIDIDRLIEKAYTDKTGKKSSCRQIFSEDGEAFFRELEHEQIQSLKYHSNCVIALGGGCLNNQKNRKILKSIGDVIYLKTATQVLWERIPRRGIPAYLNSRDPEKDFYEIAQKRIPLYEETAKYIIDTTHLSEQQVIEAILSTYKVEISKIKESSYGK